MKFLHSLILTLIYLVCLFFVYLCHSYFFFVDVVFYSALVDSVIAALIVSCLMYSSRIFQFFTSFEKFQLVLIWFFIGYAFSISVPTVIDRSLSFYILEKIQQRGGGIKKDSVSGIFINEYMKEHRLVDVRVTEQLESGTIKIVGECIELTQFGDFVASVGRFYRVNFLPKKRLLNDEYTDILTDPFSSSDQDVDYFCE
ncbi:MAG: hypothetical protein K6L73_05055 [Cellvibrionaceae bacterium]